ncbi:MAG: hypothetical protein AB9891_18450 [Anaerolineaceae bacterium]
MFEVEKSFPRFLLPLFVLAVSTLSCQMNIGGPTIPEVTQVPVSAEEVQNLENSIKTNFDTAAEGEPISFSVTQEQLTYYVAKHISETPASFVQNPQVFLRNGQIEIYGQAVSGSFSGNVMVVFHAVIDETGAPVIQLATADFGPIPVPEGMMDGVSAMMNEALTGSLGTTASGFKLDSITIEDGVMTITGKNL